MGIYREVFGPSKEDIWRQLSDEIGASYVEEGFWHGDKVQARSGEWTVTLDTGTVATGGTHRQYTRLRAPFVNADGFRFLVYRAGVFSELGKLMGMQDVEVGFPEFDGRFIIKGSDDALLQRLFYNDKIRALLEAQPNVRFEVVADQGVEELRFQASGIIQDIGQLKQLFELFAITLDQLCEIGSAYRTSPGGDL